MPEPAESYYAPAEVGVPTPSEVQQALLDKYGAMIAILAMHIAKPAVMVALEENGFHVVVPEAN